MTATTETLLGPEPARYMADGGLETTLIFNNEIELPEFAAFPLVNSPSGRAALAEYYQPYLQLAFDRKLGMVLDTPTRRASPDWAAKLGYKPDALVDVNRKAVRFVKGIAAGKSDVDVVINGTIGPRSDRQVVGGVMTIGEATLYHRLQVEAFAEARADMITAVTMTYVEEAIGIARAAGTAGLPVVIGFTVETDGNLPAGTKLADAIAAVDAAAKPAWFMVNCAHPSHFEPVLAAGGTWLERIKAIRANASRLSHAELNEAAELDRGDLDELAEDYHRLAELLPELRVIGGCWGTDHEHVARFCAAVS